jgi:hypothetical protein
MQTFQQKLSDLNGIAKDRVIVADGEHGWEVRLFADRGFSGNYHTLADGMTEDQADAYVQRLLDVVTVH